MREKTDRNLPSRVNSGRGSAPAGIPLGRRLRGLLALGLCLCLALGLPGAPALAAEAPATKWSETANYDTSWYNNTDTEFTLTTAKQLAGLAVLVNAGNNFSGKTVKLGAGIDLSAHLWEPIGYWEGSFDGGGKTVSGMTVSGNARAAGFFADIEAAGSVHSLNLRNASVSSKVDDYVNAGILVGYLNGGTVYDCTVSGSVNATGGNESTSNAYVGGLVGEGNNGSTVKNCSARLTSLTATVPSSNAACRAGGILGTVFSGYITVENCFADADAVTLTAGGGTSYIMQHRIAPEAKYSYWDSTGKLTDSAATNYTQCYGATAEQIAGTGSTVIGQGSDTYANTASLVDALNGWAAAQSGGPAYSDWALKNGAPLPKLFVPTYIDIGVIPEQSKESVTGDVNADVELHGQVWENAELLSVTLPATIPFILDVDGTGGLKRVLSATATLTNRSDMGVKVTLTEVADTDSLLGKVSLSLVPDPLPTGGSVALSAGGGKTDELASLAAQAAGVPTTCTLKVDGAAKAGVPSVGGDGDTFTVGLTLKVGKS